MTLTRPSIRTVRPLCASLCGVAIALSLSACTTTSQPMSADPDLLREALRGAADPAPQPAAPAEDDTEPAGTSPRQRIIEGAGRPVPAASASTGADATRASADGEAGEIVLNFTDQPIEAVINSVLGDLLGESYSIAQGVEGTVSFSTSSPVGEREALSILETLLSWTDNAMIRQGDRYQILPASQAVAGKLVPELPISHPPAGLSARLYPLDYIDATQMQTLLEPFVRDDAFLLVDPARNLIGLAGTPQELANYQDTIDTFDVDWLKGMSIGVYGLEHASVASLMPQLRQVFGEGGGMPLSGMVRFLPNERTNSIIAISSQPDYLSEVGSWIRAIDEGGGNEPQLHVYDVRNLKASELAGYLRQIYGSGRSAERSDASQDAAEVAPGLETTDLMSLNGGDGGAAGAGLGGAGMDADAESAPGATPGRQGGGDGRLGGASGEMAASTRITAQESSNQLLVRARPAQWKEIESAIERLDQPPRQVQIETRILEVRLTGALNQGVQWYLGQLAGNASNPSVANASGSQGALGAGGVSLGGSSMFYSFVGDNLQVALRALQTRGLTQVLSAPSLVVLNNQQAQIQVGDNIPVNQTTVNTADADTTLSSVEYVQTGVILNVVPRINPGGLVYMDIQQQVSDADDNAAGSTASNPRISTRAVSTQVAVQSGQTVLLGGLIQQNNAESETRVPGLSSIPGLGWLFGSEARDRDRTELIVLITPKVVNNPVQAREITNDYRRQMQLLKARMDEASSS
ncbi:type II secretion system secretin GspD [Halomonas elongata]|uniref:type II secretion system secretin GspD n=2 Tax=Halomonas elongata TaxID=2746 RepID=UPI002E2E2BE0|nr:type II secretion system secretin GspD [Halomonas elongata]WVI70086.1 type II secretion system secretin GspD [Halomonas elongata]